MIHAGLCIFSSNLDFFQLVDIFFLAEAKGRVCIIYVSRKDTKLWENH